MNSHVQLQNCLLPWAARAYQWRLLWAKFLGLRLRLETHQCSCTLEWPCPSKITYWVNKASSPCKTLCRPKLWNRIVLVRLWPTTAPWLCFPLLIGLNICLWSKVMGNISSWDACATFGTWVGWVRVFWKGTMCRVTWWPTDWCRKLEAAKKLERMTLFFVWNTVFPTVIKLHCSSLTIQVLSASLEKETQDDRLFNKFILSTKCV